MNHRRMITTFTLVMFLPLAIGCSTSWTSVVDLNSDPETSEALLAFHDGQPLTIIGYTRISDGYRGWSGVVHVNSPDSLRFTSDRDGVTFALPRADVATVVALLPEQRTESPESPDEPMTRRKKETAVTVGIFVAAVGAAAAVYAAQN